VNDNVPGLLYYVTRALASLGLDIHSAKITTWAGRAEDAFYITRRNATLSMLLNDGADNAATSTHNAMAQMTAPQGPASARDQKISDDDIKAVLEEVQKRLQKPTTTTQAIA
jgi:hypothetical protein